MMTEAGMRGLFNRKRNGCHPEVIDPRRELRNSAWAKKVELVRKSNPDWVDLSPIPEARYIPRRRLE
jgi:hypothetical protein